MNLINFLKYNPQKRLTVLSYIYSAWFRLGIKFIPPKRLHKKWGIQGGETPFEEVPWKYRYARNVATVVDRICTKTAWESKCLVRALTAQKLLKNKGIGSTLYLGCGLEDGKMVAHAWLRVGKMYVTGGDGVQYSKVDQYAVLIPEEKKE